MVSILDVEKSHSLSITAPRPLTRLPPQPSSAALGLAEELIDYVSYGLTRREHIREIAAIIDEAYNELVEAAGAVAAAEPAVGEAQLVRLREALRRLEEPAAAANH